MAVRIVMIICTIFFQLSFFIVAFFLFWKEIMGLLFILERNYGKLRLIMLRAANNLFNPCNLWSLNNFP